MNYYIIRSLERLPGKPHPRSPNKVQRIMVGQFPLAIDLVTGVFSFGGSRLTVAEWIVLSGEVDKFLEKYGWVERMDVHKFLEEYGWIDRPDVQDFEPLSRVSVSRAGLVRRTTRRMRRCLTRG